MINNTQSATYNLGAVLKETGLKPDVLRAWEKRYGMPNPVRSPGGHRLYSKSDIDTILWLKARQTEGLSISRAVKLWKEMTAAGRQPFLEYPLVSTVSTGLSFHQNYQLEEHRQAWIDACLAFDHVRADQVLNQAFALNPPETVSTEVLQAGLREVGRLWHAGKATVQQEHFMTAEADRRLQILLSVSPPPHRPHTILVACPAGELHAFPALLVTLLLRRKGFPVIFLGADTPEEQLDTTALAVNPALVVFSAQQITSAASLQSAVRLLNARSIPVAYGGLIFNRLPALQTCIPAVFLGESITAGLIKIERLAGMPYGMPSGQPPISLYTELAQKCRQLWPVITQSVNNQLQSEGFQDEHLKEANAFFGGALAAALQLGTPAYLEPDLAWIEALLSQRSLPARTLHLYLAAFSRVLQKTLGPASAPVTAWLEQYLNSKQLT